MTQTFRAGQKSKSPTTSSPVQTSQFASRPFPEPVQQKAQQPNLQTILQRAERAGNPISEKPIQKQEESIPNQTGLPDNLKAGVENLSGYSLDNVRVHYNSPKPAQLQALAYTQGTEIHVAPGQEKHLPHEAWHVVQQMQGRVKPTMQMKGVQINDDVGLEKEAEQYGKESKKMTKKQIATNRSNEHPSPVIQAFFARPDNIPDRHALPNPDTPDNFASWYYGLVEKRVFDLFRTAEGFIGHAMQVQGELNRVINHVQAGTYDNFDTEFWKNFSEAMENIKKYLVRLGRRCVENLAKYIFYFPWSKALSLERTGGILYVNGTKDIN